MREAERKPTRVLILAVLMAGTAAGILAQAGSSAVATTDPQLSGALSGRLTDLRSAPLAGVTVILCNQSTGAEMRTTTGKKGAYRFAAVEPGAYSLRAESEQLGRGQLEDIEVAAGHEARVQAAMKFEPAPAAMPAPSALRVRTTPAPFSAQPVRAVPKNEMQPATPTAASSLEPQAAGTQPPAGRLSAARAELTTQATETAATVPPPATAILPVEAHSPEEPATRLPATPNNAPGSQTAKQADLAPAPQAAAHADLQPASRTQTQSQALAALNPPAPPAGELSGSVPPAVHVVAAPALSVAAGAAVLHAVLADLANVPQLSRAQSAANQPGIAAVPVTTTLSGEQLQSLPVSGRRWQDLFLDTPTATPGLGNTPLALRGAGTDPADLTIDGASMRLAFGGSGGTEPALPAQDPSAQGEAPGETANEAGGGWSGGRGLAMSTVAIREVRVVAGNVEADGAHAAGGRAGVETESGGDSFHGQGFFSDRQNTWGAQNPFTTWVKETAPATATTTPVFTPEPYTPPDHETSWGLSAGSRIRRDKLFWFGALDSYHRNDPGLAMAKEPIGTDLTAGTAEYGDCYGFFCQPSVPQTDLLCAQLGLTVPSPVGPSSCPFTEATAAYSQMLESLDGLLGPAPRTAAQWVGFARIDWQATERHRFSLEGTGADWNSPGGGLTRVSENYGNHSFGSSHASEEWLLARWEAFLTPNLLAVTQGSAGREILSARPDTPSAFEQGFLGPGWNSYGQLPQIVVDSRYGFTIGNPSRFGQGSYPDERMIHGQEMVDWVRGKLLVKAGFELDHNVDVTTMLRNQTGTYHYPEVQNFISDALVFEKFGVTNLFNYQNPHNCDATGRVWSAGGTLMGLGALPCYSSFSQVIGPNFWQVGTNDWAGSTTAQWQLNKFAVFSAGLRWEREQLPPPIKLVDNPALPLTEHLPNLGNEWGPRMSLALGNLGRWPVLRLGYGMYFGRTQNATLETALSQTGSLKGDLPFFIRPTDGLNLVGTSGAPAFPTVLTGPPGSVMVPGATEFAPNFRNPEVHQALAAAEQQLPGRVMLTASAMLSLGRRLPADFDANIDPAVNPGTGDLAITYNVCDQVPAATGSATATGGAPIGNAQCGHLGLGPIKATQITVPFYALWPAGLCPAGAKLNVAGQCGWLNSNYQQITEIESRANSTYEAAMLRATRYGERGLSLHAHYIYAHAMDWNPGESPLNPAIFSSSQDYAQEYGASNLDVRHSAAVMLIYEAPWKLGGVSGRFGNGWMVSGIGQFHSGLPYTMRVTGSLPEEFSTGGAALAGLGPGMNGSGGDSRVYGVGNDGQDYDIGRNTFRYPETWKADLRLGKKFFLGEGREFELLAESFNLFNHQNVTEIETTGYFIESGTPPDGSGMPATLPTLNFLTGLKTNAETGLPIPGFGQPLNVNGSDFYSERQIQLGARYRF